ncbi:MAG: glycogen debranching protein GlgX [Mitsuaria chitosanitabida]|uniref:glycogen debranching protein GlgX n=1 Tax=Roseateles chitosanitabidus TaxID=65048 RepID=UPI001B11E4EC|nr:glycogen debranching protein GlgX [Roseateles chitosanitabidus]MBO9686396.1 glycogen debranching protein GlgX [Roseateles chitosanitabidus]
MTAFPDVLLPGRHEPLGATARDGGVNFAVFSAHATRVELCLYDEAGTTELKRVALQGPVDGLWTGFAPGLRPGQVYGLRAHGPHAPREGHRFNPSKLLLDPYAREIVGEFRCLPEDHGYPLGHPDGPLALDERDNGPTALKARVAAPLAGASPRANAPRHAPADVVLYEVHVKGFSMRHPEIPEALRGSYAGLAHPAAIAHFKRLGVTTLSLLPVQHAVDEPHLFGTGLRNYWGYNTLGFFAPDPRLASGAVRHDPAAVAAEFRAMVHALHEAGLEVVLDVVYNHTPEGNEWGPTLSLRGLDQKSYYRLDPEDPSRLQNVTACGNTVNVEHPRVTQLVLDSLRFWVGEMGVDGFRFDLAPVLGRTAHGHDPAAPFYTALRQDPLLAQVHLIAEPWDAAPGGYQLGRFPGRFMEWNDKFRDAARGFWLGHGPEGTTIGRGEFARRFSASSDVFDPATPTNGGGRRSPLASINFLAVHDGYTLSDLVSYAGKHNEANGEDNRDGRDGELCGNFGVEGPTDDPVIRQARERARRAMLATLLLSQGTPMLYSGDEFGNGQGGNNNAYCQDNEIGWLDWPSADASLIAFTAELARLRKAHGLLRRASWFAAGDDAGNGGDRVSLRWFHPEGHEMRAEDWNDADGHALSALLSEAGGEGAATRSESLLLMANPGGQPRSFGLPAPIPGTATASWTLLLDSTGESSPGARVGDTLLVPARGLVLCRAGG